MHAACFATLQPPFLADDVIAAITVTSWKLPPVADIGYCATITPIRERDEC